MKDTDQNDTGAFAEVEQLCAIRERIADKSVKSVKSEFIVLVMHVSRIAFSWSTAEMLEWGFGAECSKPE